MSRPQDRSQSARDAASQFSITMLDDQPGRVRVLAEGELDIASFDELDGALRDAATRAHRVLLDITAVSFIDSTGLRAIVCAHQDAQGTGREFVLSAAMPDVQRTLELSGLAPLFRREPARQQPEDACQRHEAREDPLALDPLAPAPTPPRDDPEPLEPTSLKTPGSR